MEQESFEDKDAAALLNNYFIPIKVDREERPDVDHLYMIFCQVLTGQGGWPLTILMTPEKKPFFAGTYFPKTQHCGHQGLMELLEQAETLWSTKEEEIRNSAEEIFNVVNAGQAKTTKSSDSTSPSSPFGNNLMQPEHKSAGSETIQNWGEQIIEEAYASLAGSFDARYGGFGRAPKFPTPHHLTFLLRYAADHPQSKALEMVRKTLDGMALGGICDHIGFGYARYSTDEKWLIPHFEKMLYDNAMLAIAYLESYQFAHRPEDAQKAEEIFTYILRDMTDWEGGFYCAEDADAEGIEGKFQVWTPAEVEAVLGKEKAVKFCAVYDITAKGNFEGKNNPNLLQGALAKIARENNQTESEVLSSLEGARQSLFLAREKRIHPHKDDKILTAWNGLMIKGAQVLGKDLYLKAAAKAADFVLTRLMRKDGRLLARYRAGEAAHLGYLDDYAFLIWGLIELYSAGGRPRYLKTALRLQEEQESLFSDEENGGYYLTGSDAEELLFRPKESYDGALPAGNSITALNLLRLTRLTGDGRWGKKAEQQLFAFRAILEDHPAGYTAFLQALQYALHPSQELILAGSLANGTLSEMRQTFFSEFRPYSSVLYQEGSLPEIIPWTKEYPVDPSQAKAYLCQNFTCQRPVQNIEEFKSLLM